MANIRTCWVQCVSLCCPHAFSTNFDLLGMYKCENYFLEKGILSFYIWINVKEPVSLAWFELYSRLVLSPHDSMIAITWWRCRHLSLEFERIVRLYPVVGCILLSAQRGSFLVIWAVRYVGITAEVAEYIITNLQPALIMMIRYLLLCNGDGLSYWTCVGYFGI